MRRILLLAFFAAMSLATAETLSYTDKMGRKLRIPVPVQRAAVFQLYEFVPALKCWDRVAGVGRYTYQNDLMLATKPDIEARIPSAGSGTDVNIEALLKLKPDVVLTWTYKPESIHFMEQKGLNVIAVYPDTLAEMFSLLELQGRLFGREREAQRTAQAMNRMFDFVRDRAARLPAPRRRKVLWIGSRQNGVAGAGGLTHELIRMLGAQNVAGGISQRNADVSVETIVSWNPDVIFIWGNAKYGVNDILSNPQWRFIKAVREKRVFKAPEWSTWSPRLGPIVLWMASKTYPEIYHDVDVHAAGDRFCRDVFGVPLTKIGLNDF